MYILRIACWWLDCKGLNSGVRGSALTSPGNDFSVQLNAKMLCETGAYLAKAKVAGVDEALATCQCVACVQCQR